MQLSIDELKTEIQVALKSPTPLEDILVLIAKDRLNHFNYIMSMNTAPSTDEYNRGYDAGFESGFEKGSQISKQSGNPVDDRFDYGYEAGFDAGYLNGRDELIERIKEII